jgi:hypothetical protein
MLAIRQLFQKSMLLFVNHFKSVAKILLNISRLQRRYKKYPSDFLDGITPFPYLRASKF